jgi:SNF2 family DNA or RNA helicase
MYEMLTKPYDHQQRVYDESKDREYYAGFWEMGLGKSKLVLDTSGHLFSEGKIDALLIVAPKGVYQTWYYDQIPEHLGLEDYFYGIYRSAPRKADKMEMAKMLLPEKDGDLMICIMNTESFSHKSGVQYAEKFLRQHRTLMVIDESTAIKTPSATRTKTLVKLGQLAHYRRILTGTPITQSPLDMFAQCQFLKKGVLGFTSWTAFKSYFAIQQVMRMGTRSFTQITGFQNLDELEELIRPFSSRIKKTDCLDLPEKIYSTRYVEMTPPQKKAYEELKEMAVLEFENNLVTSTSALTTVLKLQQIVCGHCKDDDHEAFDIPSNRINVLKEIVDEQPGDAKIIIFANFQRDIQLVTEELNKQYGRGSAVEYYGKTNNEDRAENIRRFRTDPACRFFVSSSAGSKGITLIESNLTVYYSNSYNLETRLQSEDRNHRIGQKSVVNYIDLITPDTIDIRIVAALKRKESLANTVMDALRDEVYN